MGRRRRRKDVNGLKCFRIISLSNVTVVNITPVQVQELEIALEWIQKVVGDIIGVKMPCEISWLFWEVNN